MPEAFINSILLLNQLANTADLKAFLAIFVKAKLEEKALEAVPTTANTVILIIKALRSKISPDNSKIIEGRMFALRTSRKISKIILKKPSYWLKPYNALWL